LALVVNIFAANSAPGISSNSPVIGTSRKRGSSSPPTGTPPKQGSSSPPTGTSPQQGSGTPKGGRKKRAFF